MIATVINYVSVVVMVTEYCLLGIAEAVLWLIECWLLIGMHSPCCNIRLAELLSCIDLISFDSYLAICVHRVVSATYQW